MKRQDTIKVTTEFPNGTVVEVPARGRRHDPTLDPAILEATIEIMAELGYDSMTIAQRVERQQRIGGGVEVYIVDSIKRNHLVNARVGEHHIIF